MKELEALYSPATSTVMPVMLVRYLFIYSRGEDEGKDSPEL